MTIKKLSLAAALTIGLMAGTMASFAACGCGCGLDNCDCGLSPNVTGGACPLSQCESPKIDRCNKCGHCADDCTCKKHKKHKCNEKCGDPCEKKCDPCKKKSKKNDCNTGCAAPVSCEPAPVPACASCPSNCAPMHMQQSYAYPNAIYGGNQIVGENNAGVIVGSAYSMAALAPASPCARANCPSCNVASEAYGIAGLTPINPYANANCGCDCNPGLMTGAAVQMPCNACDEACPVNTGARVHRNPCDVDEAKCPINIETQTSTSTIRKSMMPFDITSTPTGAAVPLVSAFEDVPDGFWASCEINKLTENNIIAGYPDRTFKPNLPISRAEFAAMTTKGLCMEPVQSPCKQHFKDVPRGNWAEKAINTAVANGLLAGYPNNKFKPHTPVSRAEAMTILGKGMGCNIDECKADSILSQYSDGCTVPNWAKIPVARALESGILSNSPQPNMVKPDLDATRADLAAMLQNTRITLGYATNDIASADCGCAGGAAFIETEEMVSIPTLQLTFGDEISARTANIGDQFAATTIDSVTINGVEYAAGSLVRGKVLEVIRPTKNCEGGLKLSFDTIKCGDCKADLPRQVLNAKVNCMKKPNALVRLVELPFAWTGAILGNIGRTVGGGIVNLGNAAEHVATDFGVGTGELITGQFRAAGRSYQDSAKALVMGPVNTVRTALSGTMGLFQVTGDELTYLVDPNGMKVSSINPKEKITISFGCGR